MLNVLLKRLPFGCPRVHTGSRANLCKSRARCKFFFKKHQDYEGSCEKMPNLTSIHLLCRPDDIVETNAEHELQRQCLSRVTASYRRDSLNRPEITQCRYCKRCIAFWSAEASDCIQERLPDFGLPNHFTGHFLAKEGLPSAERVTTAARSPQSELEHNQIVKCLQYTSDASSVVPLERLHCQFHFILDVPSPFF